MTDPRLSFVSDLTAHGSDEVLTILGGTTVLVSVDPHTLQSPAGQVLCYQLGTLLARLFDRVDFSGDESASGHPNLPHPNQPFLNTLRHVMSQVRPAVPRPRTGLNVKIGIGENVGPCDLYLGSTPWSALFSMLESQPVTDTATTLGALASGTLGAAEVFKYLFGQRISGAYQAPTFTLNLLNYSAAQGAEIELPATPRIEATLFGVGSIGMGFLQAATSVPDTFPGGLKKFS